MSYISYVHRFISSLIFTDVVEILILFFFVRFLIKDKELKTTQILFAGLYASFSTIPYVWFVLPYLKAPLFISELFVFIIEAIFYRAYLKLDWEKVFLLSFFCNMASFIFGPILRSHGIWIYW